MSDRVPLTARELVRIAYAAGLADGAKEPWIMNDDPAIEALLMAIREEYFDGPREALGPSWLRALQGAASD